jgi:NADP-dependent 3-hydroxy acid dehydrogenase YdfG
MARILVTGASRGIGRATAVALAERGHQVIATARDVAALDDVPAAQRLSLDVTDQVSVDAAIAAAGRVDVLVSNAGATVRAPVETVPLAAVQQLIELNTLGSLRVAQAVLPGMRAQGSGQLIFVSSIQGRLVIPLIGAYGASKWALEALAETLAIEARPFGVSVHVLQPGAVSSGGAERGQVYLDDANPYRPLLDKIGGFRSAPITVEEVAGAVAATVEQGSAAPFRSPVGEPAEIVLAARKAAPEDAPFLAAPLDW